MSKFIASRLTLLGITAASGALTATLTFQPDLTSYQVDILQTAGQVCYASTTALISLEGARKLSEKNDPKLSSDDGESS